MVPARLVLDPKRKPSADEGSSRASWNTPRSHVGTAVSYTSRMTVSFALTALMTVLVLIVVISFVWSGVFSDYTRANVEEVATLTADRLAEGYEEDGNRWMQDTLVAIARSSMISDDIGVQVLDATGTIIYDDTSISAALTSSSQGSDDEKDGASKPGKSGEDAEAESLGAAPDAHGVVSTAPSSRESTVTVPITDDEGERIGTVRMWVLGSDVLLTKADTVFREKTFEAMGLAAVIAIVIAVVMGLFFSRALTNQLRRIMSVAKQIRDGDLSARTGLKGDDELDQLGETFDEMASSLEKDLKRERRLTSDVAHELRTPLMAMLATVEAMQDGVYPADYEHLETVASETRRLSRLVQQMLDLSRMENHTAPLNIEDVEMVSFVRNIVRTQEPLFAERDLRLRFSDETEGRPVEIEADPDMITQAVINLLSNAMRYTPEGGWVVVRVGTDKRNVTVSVSDTGIGIAKEDLSRVFGRFWRADASRAREAGGLGVGLAVTKQIVERHHGFIAVESELGKGTTFTIHLPREHHTSASSSTIER